MRAPLAARGEYEATVCKLSRDQELSVGVPHKDRINRADIARGEQPVPTSPGGVHEHRQTIVIQGEGSRRFRHAVPESHANRAIDLDPQVMHLAFSVHLAHMPSSPRSVRASSMTAGVISSIARSCAHSA